MQTSSPQRDFGVERDVSVRKLKPTVNKVVFLARVGLPEYPRSGIHINRKQCSPTNATPYGVERHLALWF
ncbi:MAG: hypothetical protein LBR48_04460, partial [Dysgonamonadaceae bacterium]|nr:hypothetical protein [Dysgonamonadaceae bacterium]